jgi:hypothetical protein
MRIDRRDIVVDDHRIEVKAVAEPADDGELVVARRRHRSTGWCSWRRVRIRRMRARVRVGRRRIWRCRPCHTGSRTGRDAQVERVDEPVVRRIINANLPGLPHGGRTRKREDQVRIRTTPVAASAGNRVTLDCAVGRASVRARPRSQRQPGCVLTARSLCSVRLTRRSSAGDALSTRTGVAAMPTMDRGFPRDPSQGERYYRSIRRLPFSSNSARPDVTNLRSPSD